MSPRTDPKNPTFVEVNAVYQIPAVFELMCIRNVKFCILLPWQRQLFWKFLVPKSWRDT